MAILNITLTKWTKIKRQVGLFVGSNDIVSCRKTNKLNRLSYSPVAVFTIMYSNIKIGFFEDKRRISLTVPNRNHFARVSLTVLDNFLDAIAKAKKLIHESIAQNLMPVSLTKSFLALAMAFNLLLSNPT